MLTIWPWPIRQKRIDTRKIITHNNHRLDACQSGDSQLACLYLAPTYTYYFEWGRRTLATGSMPTMSELLQELQQGFECTTFESRRHTQRWPICHYPLIENRLAPDFGVCQRLVEIVWNVYTFISYNLDNGTIVESTTIRNDRHDFFYFFLFIWTSSH